MQAQDYSMAIWAIGVRLSDSDEKKIETSFNNGEILRIHVLRPTWHFVSPDDIYWMINLTAPKIKSSVKSRHRHLELSESIINKSNSIIEKELGKRISLTREELATEFHKAGIKTDANRLSHLLFCAELEGIICSGPLKSKKHTYSLLSDRVPDKKSYQEMNQSLNLRNTISQATALQQSRILRGGQIFPLTKYERRWTQ